MMCGVTQEWHCKETLSNGVRDFRVKTETSSSPQQRQPAFSYNRTHSLLMGREVKITVVGDSEVGKTCLCISYATNSFPTEYVPTVFDNYNTKAVIEGNPMDILIFDTAGDAEYDSIRSLNYSGTDVFLICFSVLSTQSAEGVIKKWAEEVRGKCPDANIILIGTKCDMRSDATAVTDSTTVSALKNTTGMEPISKEQGTQLAEVIGAQKFMECSALTGMGLSAIFEESIKLVLHPKLPPKPAPEKIKGCIVQ
ncbi:putative RAC GTPase [Planoprotostelium fungivorum]|uniref:Putative RAC GTPase n=1 Tax=Planoprotostelium fungivorum TaxID=1890364 RepID=A0A2P6NXH2_9EUKA|nr:putative RAC GTPase [Planoprotostelium fungivorum]